MTKQLSFTGFRCELSETDKFNRYLRENGLEVAGLADWVRDPQYPQRLILGVPVRPVQFAPETTEESDASE